MSQQPNIQIEPKKNIEDSDLPVPRSQGKDILSNPLRSPNEEVFSIPSPDSGYALKLIKPFTVMWKENHKHKLITKVITNLVIYQASKIGRAPTKNDVIKVIDVLKISDSDTGVLDSATLKICSSETIQGLHLSELFDANQ
jgi:hypothetical protein